MPGRSVPPATVARSAALRPRLALQVRTWPRGLQGAFSFFPQTNPTGLAFAGGLRTPSLSREAVFPESGPGHSGCLCVDRGCDISLLGRRSTCSRGHGNCRCPAVSAFLPAPGPRDGRSAFEVMEAAAAWDLLLRSFAVGDEGDVVSPIVTPSTPATASRCTGECSARSFLCYVMSLSRKN